MKASRWEFGPYPNPGISPDDEFAESAAEAKLPYPKLLQRLLTLGRNYVPGSS